MEEVRSKEIAMRSHFVFFLLSHCYRANQTSFLDKNLEKKFKLRGGPTWYQELSDCQMKAADQLFEGLRDDLEEGTCHRCLKLIIDLGIFPIESIENVKTALEMSRGNDLAFLWFLGEAFYFQSSNFKTTREYSINERIILSSICHLDMITTLRELDRILPKPKAKPKPIKLKKFCVCRCSHISPYLEPIPRPKFPVSKSLPPPIIPGPNLKPYNKYKDSNYIVRNESNRWFASKIKTSAEQIVESVINEITSENFDRKIVLDSLCLKHRNEKERKAKLLEILAEGTKCCMEQRVVHQIDLDVAKTKEEFEELAKKYQNQTVVKVLIKELIENAQEVKNIKACQNCVKCIEEYEKFKEILSKNNFLDFGHEEKPKENEKFFKRSTPQCPYKFDYEKIFLENIIHESAIKKGVRLALELDKYATEDEAITVCMQNLWQLEVKLWNERMMDCHEDEKIVQDVKPSVLRKMLIDSLKTMRENPKFVLASIPQAFKLPIFKEWILDRFGHKYTEKEREDRLKASREFWDKLLNISINIELPRREDICAVNKLNWDYMDYLRQAVSRLLKDYYNRLNIALIKESRQLWPTMEPYLCPMGPPREVFYAYMPASEYDALLIRPWKTNECKTFIKTYSHCK